MDDAKVTKVDEAVEVMYAGLKEGWKCGLMTVWSKVDENMNLDDAKNNEMDEICARRSRYGCQRDG